MELVVANLTGNLRRETFHGRKHLVVPITLIVPGVLNGSKGPLFYPPDEVSKNVAAWNGMPLVVYHPGADGSNVTARSPGVLAKQGVGTIFNASSNGKLSAEAWFDEEQTRNVDPRVLAALEKGEKIEISTGLFTDNEPAENDAHHEGIPYTFIARNYRPDHVAILPDQRGACSLKDGCGINNKESVVLNYSPVIDSYSPVLNAYNPSQPRDSAGRFGSGGGGGGGGTAVEKKFGGDKFPNDSIKLSNVPDSDLTTAKKMKQKRASEMSKKAAEAGKEKEKLAGASLYSSSAEKKFRAASHRKLAADSSRMSAEGAVKKISSEQARRKRLGVKVIVKNLLSNQSSTLIANYNPSQPRGAGGRWGSGGSGGGGGGSAKSKDFGGDKSVSSKAGVRSKKAKKRTISQAGKELEAKGYAIVPGGPGYDTKSMTARYKVKSPDGKTSIMTVADIEKIIGNQSSILAANAGHNSNRKGIAR